MKLMVIVTMAIVYDNNLFSSIGNGNGNGNGKLCFVVWGGVVLLNGRCFDR